MNHTLKACMVCLGMIIPAARGESAVRTYDQLLKLNPHRSIEDPADWPLKVTSLLRSEYDFFRGTADLFYAHAREVCADWMAQSQYHIPIHGDVHLGNIGTYQGPGAPGVDLHVGLVDFDEAFDGPFQLDLLRGLTSLRVAATTSGISPTESDFAEASRILVKNYAQAFIDPASSSSKITVHPMAQRILKEARSGRMPKYLAKYTEENPPRFRRARESKGNLEDVMRPLDAAERKRLIAAWHDACKQGFSESDRARLRSCDSEVLESAILDIALWTRVGSSGSQGLRKYLVLLAVPLSELKENLILQLKEEPAPAAARAGLVQAATGAQRAAYVCATYRAQNNPTQWLLGHTVLGDVGYLIKTKDPWGEELSTNDVRDVPSLHAAAALMGTLLGRAHQFSAPAKDAIRDYLNANSSQLSELLTQRSRACQLFLSTACADLRSDDRAADLSKRAALWLSQCSTSK